MVVGHWVEKIKLPFTVADSDNILFMFIFVIVFNKITENNSMFVLSKS